MNTISYLKPNTIKLAIFASGTGSNALKIIEHFANHNTIQVSLIVSNHADAGVVNIAKKHNIHSLIIEKDEFVATGYSSMLKEYGVQWLILAGFLWKIPSVLLQCYPNRVINIHPALLPKYGGKGMYGLHVHEAVIANNDSETGITIHFANEHYDEGKHIFQAKCVVLPSDTAATIAKKVQVLEHEHFAPVIEKVLVNI
jgi:phosphoribosylglycinamide formyltransferase 1